MKLPHFASAARAAGDDIAFATASRRKPQASLANLLARSHNPFRHRACHLPRQALDFPPQGL